MMEEFVIGLAAFLLFLQMKRGKQQVFTAPAQMQSTAFTSESVPTSTPISTTIGTQPVSTQPVTSVGVRGEGQSMQTLRDGLAVFSLRVRNPFANSRGTPRPGNSCPNKMVFFVEIINPNPFPLQKPNIESVDVAIVSVADAAQFGNTPPWFRSFIINQLPENVQTPFAVIDSQLQRIESQGGELSLTMLDQLPVIRTLHYSREQLGIVGSKIRSGGTFSTGLFWDFRNEIRECIAAGDYAAIGWVTMQNGDRYPTGWMRFVVV